MNKLIQKFLTSKASRGASLFALVAAFMGSGMDWLN